MGMKRVLRVYKKTVSLMEETPVEIFQALRRGKKCFLLESHDKQEGRYTFLGVDPNEII
jgi:anthranilate synthase component 1